MVPDDTKTIRERAIAAWPTAWGGQNQRDIAVTMGIDVDIPWRDVPKKDRDFLLFSEDHPVVPVYAGYTPAEDAARAEAQGGAELPGHLHQRAAAYPHQLRQHREPADEEAGMQFMINSECTLCHGKRLKREALSIKFAGLDITEMSRLPLKRVTAVFAPYAEGKATPKMQHDHPEQATGGPAHRRGLGRAHRGDPGTRSRLSHFGAQHADLVAGASCSGCAWQRR